MFKNVNGMKRITFLSLLAFAVLTFFSCKPGGESQTENTSTHGDTTSAAAPEHTDADAPVVSVQLNNGAKWGANPETTSGITAMQQLVASTSATASKDDLARLAEELGNEFSIIIEKCTMSGEAHAQLHNYLMPLKETMEGLNAESPDVRTASLAQIKKQLAAYGDYFQ